MVDKPSYEDLLQRIKKLEAENAGIRQDLDRARQSENKFRIMIENIPDIIWTLSADNLRMKYISPSVETMLGYPVDEVRKKSVKEMLTPATFDMCSQYLADGIEKLKTNSLDLEQTHSLEAEYICKDGSTLWTELTAKLIVDESLKTIDIIGVSRDISKRKAVEQALRKNEEKYRTLFENSPGCDLYHNTFRHHY
jgi:PAS domain S-box-containing protein